MSTSRRPTSWRPCCSSPRCRSWWSARSSSWCVWRRAGWSASRTASWSGSCLATGITVIYTGLVAGLGRLVGGSGPTWLLVAATGVIAVLVEPARRHIRGLVDRLVYGSRDDTLSLVRQVMARVARRTGRGSAARAGRQPRPGDAPRCRRHRRRRARRMGAGRVYGAESRPTRLAPATTARSPSVQHGEIVGRLMVGLGRRPVAAGPGRADPPGAGRPARAGRELGPPGRRPPPLQPGRALRPRGGAAPPAARPARRPRAGADRHLARAAHRRPPARAARAPARCPSSSWPSHLADEVDTTVLEVKRIVRDLRPSALDELGLVGAVAEFARSFDGALALHLEFPGRTPASRRRWRWPSTGSSPRR